MNKPAFIFGGDTIYIEHPDKWEVKDLSQQNEQVSMGGKLWNDTIYKKYQLILKYSALSNTELDTITRIQSASDVYSTFGTTKFVYDKIPFFLQPQDVGIKVNQYSFRGGSGSSLYYVTADIIITPVNRMYKELSL